MKQMVFYWDTLSPHPLVFQIVLFALFFASQQE